MDNDVCVECDIDNCRMCGLDGTTCNKCSKGYTNLLDLTLSTSTCVECPVNCAQCSQERNETGGIQSENIVCTMCDTNSAMIEGQCKPQECDFTSFGEGNGVCQSCPKNCLKCKGTECLECAFEDEGKYSLVDGMCKHACQDVDTDPFTGKYWNQNSDTCEDCMDNCKWCTFE